jgi:hypothetical protein
VTARLQLAGACAAAAAGLSLVLLLTPPGAGVALALAVVAAALAVRSVAVPLALAAVVPLGLALAGWEPLSGHQLAFVLFAWLAFAIVVAVVRDDGVLPLALLLTAPLVLTLALAFWIAARFADGGATLELFFAANVTPLLAGLVVAQRGRDLGRYARLLLVPAAIAAFALWIRRPGTDEPLLAAQTLGLGLVAAVWLAYGRSNARIAAVTALPVLGLSLAVGHPRGPLVALAAGIVAVLALAPRAPAARVLAPALTVAGGAALALCALLVPGVSAHRVGSAIAGWNGLDPRLGVAGLVLVLATLGAAGAAIVQARLRAGDEERGDATLVLGLFAFAAPFGVLSGQIGGSVAAWAAAGLALGVARRIAAPVPLAEPILRIRVRTPRPTRRVHAPSVAKRPAALVLDEERFEIVDAESRVLAVVRTKHLAEVVRSAFEREGLHVRLQPVSAQTEPVSAPVVEPVGVELADPGAVLRREVELAAHVSGEADAVELQVAHAARRDWRTVARATAPFVLRLDTAGLEDGLHDFRARALAGGEVVAESAPVRVRRVDNTPPSVSLTVPPRLSGIVTLRAGATDDGAGVVSVLFQFERDGVWHPVVAQPSGVAEVEWDTTRLADGPVRVRVVAVDSARNSATSEPVETEIANAPVAPAAPEQPVLTGAATIFDLERMLAERPHPDPFVQAEREALVFYLRDFARVDGSIPEQFSSLLADAFGV